MCCSPTPTISSRAVAMRSSRKRARQAVAEDAPTPRSSLYDRANGFSFGCFLSLIRYRFARPAYRFHRERILEFAAEAGLPIAVPSSQAAYDTVADRVLQE